MKQSIRICIDSCVFIFGLQEASSASGKLLDLVGPNLDLMIPRIVAKEVDRNLTTTEQKRRFHRLFHDHFFASVSDQKVPRQLLEKYVGLGLREKGDAFIGAFAEMEHVDYLISVNRHFLKELDLAPFETIDPTAFISRLSFGK